MKEEICSKIIEYTKNEILCRSSFMSAAFGFVSFILDDSAATFAVYGDEIFYNSDFLIKTFLTDNGRTLSRFFLHCIFHFVCSVTSSENKENDPIKRLADDIMTERIIDEIFVFNSMDSFYDVSMCNKSFRRKVYSYISAHTKMMTSKRIKKTMTRKNTNLFEVFDKNSLLSEFTFDTELTITDDERDNYKKEKSMHEAKETKENAHKAAKMIKIKTGAAGKGDIGYILDVSSAKRNNYKDFLRKFTVVSEVSAENSDVFDYALYNYGVECFGVPIIEAVEYKEEHTLDGFVIAIDTSASCPLDKVRKFLTVSCEIIRESIQMSENINVYVVQCDYKIRDVKKIKNVKDVEVYSKNIRINGGGGTDFTPVFEYIDNMNESVRGLIYFTDGNGKFPKQAPNYETAFIFLESDKNTDVPAWAKKITVDEEEI